MISLWESITLKEKRTLWAPHGRDDCLCGVKERSSFINLDACGDRMIECFIEEILSNDHFVEDAISVAESTSKKHDMTQLAQRAKVSGCREILSKDHSNETGKISGGESLNDSKSDYGRTKRKYRNKISGTECKEISSENRSKDTTGKVSGGESLNDAKGHYGRTKRKYGKKISDCEQPVYMSASSTEHVKLKRARSNDMKSFSQEIDEDEVELTVEDLLSIANEFVRSAKHEQATPRKSQQKVDHMISVAKDVKISGSAVSSQQFTKCSQTSCHAENEVEHKSEKAASSSACEFIGTGDAAHDMLKLFLGPLLQKSPPPGRWNPEITPELLTSVYQSGSSARSLVDVEDDALLMKKKCSLKEKVAMFLN
ncbi:hypothetical protein AXF42_Ash000181 [Apostasia shenzhenica]|uniref:Uncharacterized protein n=1 Tax=Apostasia shenzhenica TaxID=1088818 RepID=A0A2I0AFN4_9ASPA|nr:hypothetical protein AXF42_Ash000181 [Apostasia shenzhenica]